MRIVLLAIAVLHLQGCFLTVALWTRPTVDVPHQEQSSMDLYQKPQADSRTYLSFKGMVSEEGEHTAEFLAPATHAKRLKNKKTKLEKQRMKAEGAQGDLITDTTVSEAVSETSSEKTTDSIERYPSMSRYLKNTYWEIVCKRPTTQQQVFVHNAQTFVTGLEVSSVNDQQQGKYILFNVSGQTPYPELIQRYLISEQHDRLVAYESTLSPQEYQAYVSDQHIEKLISHAFNQPAVKIDDFRLLTWASDISIKRLNDGKKWNRMHRETYSQSRAHLLLCDQHYVYHIAAPVSQASRYMDLNFESTGLQWLAHDVKWPIDIRRKNADSVSNHDLSLGTARLEHQWIERRVTSSPGSDAARVMLTPLALIGDMVLLIGCAIMHSDNCWH